LHFKKFLFLTLCSGAGLLLILLSGCSINNQITGLNMSSSYSDNPEDKIQLTDLYHINDSLTYISVSVPVLHQADKSLHRNVKTTSKLNYEVFRGGKRVDLVDSASYFLSDTSAFQNFYLHNCMLKATSGYEYFVKIELSNPELPEAKKLLVFMDKTDRNRQPWYRIHYEQGKFARNNIINTPQYFRFLETDTTKNSKQVLCFLRQYNTPAPPFEVVRRQPLFDIPDSTFSISFANGLSNAIKLTTPGIYFLQPDSNAVSGASVLRTAAGFPKVISHSAMRDALCYITTSKEFKILNSYSNPKVAVDSFWIAAAGRADLAVELIRKYYSRVETANQLFTSFTEGWKTDRGMVYIIMGKPNHVFIGFDSETWIYGDYDDSRSIRFYFDKVNNPYTGNDFILQRNQKYRELWYQNIDLWRR
jgi:GWxTD domain-containing protein